MINLNRLFSILLLCFMILAVAFGLVCRSYYLPDQALFTSNTLTDYLLLLVCLVFLPVIIALVKDVSYRRALFASILITISLQLLFIFLYPLEPFSDMKEINDIALNLNANNIVSFFEPGQYLYINPNNIYIALFLKLVYSLLPSTIFVAKGINIVSSIVTIYCIGRVYKELFGEKFIGGLLLLSSIFVPTILYSNHIYNDSISTAVFAISTWFIIVGVKNGKTKYMLLAFFVLAFGDLLRQIGIIFCIAYILFIFFKKNTAVTHKLLLAAGGGIIFYFSRNIPGLILVWLHILPASFDNHGMPIYTWIYLGLNSHSLGFQDGAQSFQIYHQANMDKQLAARLYTDAIIQRFSENGWLGNIKLVLQKFLWTWTEGTYQMERYGFGYQNSLQYQTVFSEFVDKSSIIKNLLNRTVHAYNIVLLFFSCIGIWKIKRLREEVLVLLLIILGILAFYLIWEIKSRYIFVIWPYMFIISYSGIIYFLQFVREKFSQRGSFIKR